MDIQKKLVIGVDLQNDFEDPKGALYINGADKLIKPQNDYFRTLKPWEVAAVILTFDTHTPEDYEGSAEAEQFDFHCGKGTWGHKLAVIVGTIPRGIPVFKLEKGVFSMWEAENSMVVPYDDSTLRTHHPLPRDEFFELMLKQGVKKTELVGVASDFCVPWAATGFIQRGFDVSVRRDLVKGIFREIDQVVEEDGLAIEII